MGSIFTWSQDVSFKATGFPDLVQEKERIVLFQGKKETNLKLKKKKALKISLTGYKILLLVYSYSRRIDIFSSFSIFMTITAQDFMQY